MKNKSWSYSSWENQANASFYFDSFKVYVVELFDVYEKFIKIR